MRSRTEASAAERRPTRLHGSTAAHRGLLADTAGHWRLLANTSGASAELLADTAATHRQLFADTGAHWLRPTAPHRRQHRSDDSNAAEAEALAVPQTTAARQRRRRRHQPRQRQQLGGGCCTGRAADDSGSAAAAALAAPRQLQQHAASLSLAAQSRRRAPATRQPGEPAAIADNLAASNKHQQALEKMTDEQEYEEELADYEEQEEGSSSAAAPAEAALKSKGFAAVHAVGFQDFLLKADLLSAIRDCGFEHPSEVQQECIPQAILGMDVICQAKSGMGKTAVFVLTTLQQLDLSQRGDVLVLSMCHTRELAFQIQAEYDRFSKYMPDFKSAVFYGGVPIKKTLRRSRSRRTVWSALPAASSPSSATATSSLTRSSTSCSTSAIACSRN